MANLGVLPAALDEMPAQDAFALLAWWREHPPAAEILAAVYRVQPVSAPDVDDPSGIGALIRGGSAPSLGPSVSMPRQEGYLPKTDATSDRAEAFISWYKST